jgi:hypothetical protein
MLRIRFISYSNIMNTVIVSPNIVYEIGLANRLTSSCKVNVTTTQQILLQCVH